MGLLTHWEGEPVEIWRQLWGVTRLEVHDEIGSTNDRARELARQSRVPWTVILAEFQVRGRGRGDRPWISSPGKGLLASILLPGGSLERNALAPIRVGLAGAEAMEMSQSPGGDRRPSVELKWPNDLVIGGRKVGGILCESGGNGILVAGLGINIHQKPPDFPPELRPSTTSLEMELGPGVSRAGLMGALVSRLRLRTEGRGPVLDSGELNDYQTRDHLRGRSVVSEVAGEGVGMGLTPEGHLLLQRDDGNLGRVKAGSVTVAGPVS